MKYQALNTNDNLKLSAPGVVEINDNLLIRAIPDDAQTDSIAPNRRNFTVYSTEHWRKWAIFCK